MARHGRIISPFLPFGILCDLLGREYYVDILYEYMNETKILLTGGHAATTGLAVIEEIRKRFPEAEISWIGSKFVVSGSKATSVEYKTYPSLGVKFYALTAGKLQTKFTRYTIPYLLMIPVGFIQAFFLLLKIRPCVILSFGGFSSFPVIFWGFIFGIPVVLHEQTVGAGRAAIASTFFARKIALAREESQKYFPKQKTVITGNPLSEEILSVKPKITLGNTKTILIMGGSRGSEFINEEIFKIIPKLLTKYRTIHITGERNFEKYKDYQNKNYRAVSFVDPRKMPAYYKDADLVITRSGANTVSEILYLKIPTIFIPLPRTFMDEQYKNAKYAEEFGVAKVMLETETNPESLLAEIEKMFSAWENIVSNLEKKESPDINASKKVTDLIEEYI
jgi:UDP-N-acetylglucosamine--N-acetylmuramyl-(pentapeptide) pyrophosphoryl-undecaprenol N-acetylglucosamine transferase